MKKLFVMWLTLVAVVFALGGCAGLDPAGPYKGDKMLYDADLVIDGSYAVIDGFVKWEERNHPLLKSRPEITKYADKVRTEGPRWFDSAFALRDAYVAAPTPENGAALQKAVAVLRAAMTEAAAYLALASDPSAAANDQPKLED